MQDLTCVFEGIDNKGAIFISAIHTAKNTSLLKKHNIKAVLSIARGGYIYFLKDDVTHYLYLPADDIQSYNLSQHFMSAYQFIQQARRQTNVLIHCMAGISRSATITAAYLMKKYQCSLQKVMLHLKRKRNKIDPNPGFLKQLELLQREILECKKQRQAQKTEKLQQKKQQNKQSMLYQNNSFSSTITHSAVGSFKYSISPLLTRKNQFKSKKTRETAKDQVSLKKKLSLNCRIDKLKRNLILEGRMIAQDENKNRCLSPSKLYSPMLYRKKYKLDLSSS